MRERIGEKRYWSRGGKIRTGWEDEETTLLSLDWVTEAFLRVTCRMRGGDEVYNRERLITPLWVDKGTGAVLCSPWKGRLRRLNDDVFAVAWEEQM